jgi:hypothetical protein
MRFLPYILYIFCILVAAESALSQKTSVQSVLTDTDSIKFTKKSLPGDTTAFIVKLRWLTDQTIIELESAEPVDIGAQIAMFQYAIIRCMEEKKRLDREIERYYNELKKLTKGG